MVLPVSIGFILGYLIGSFPTAYLVVKKKAMLDIRNVGSGNIGARNALEVTGSKLVGIIVLLVDFIKGTGSVALAGLLFGSEFWVLGIAGVGAVLGHNFSPWVKFKGGRGLATTAGVMIILGWMFIVIWLAIYFFSQAIVKQVHISSIIASLVSPFILLLIPEHFAGTVLFIESRIVDVFTLSAMFSAVILIRHIGPMKTIIQS
jgi:acyl phosphate:glycerol-3-phosphate acyltransferase